MMRKLLLLLALTPGAPLTSCTAAVPVASPRPACQLPSVSPYPALPSLRSEGGMVVMTPADAEALFIWTREEDRRLRKAELCLSSR